MQLRVYTKGIVFPRYWQYKYLHRCLWKSNKTCVHVRVNCQLCNQDGVMAVFYLLS